MVYPPELLDVLQAVEPQSWSGAVFRHMFAGYPPDRENTRGARWNPPDVAAIYTSLTRAGALAEAEHQLSVQPIQPSSPLKRTVYELEASLNSVLDLTDRQLLQRLGLGDAEIAGDDLTRCQSVGGAVAWLEHDGLLVPSARSDSVNLVIYPTVRSADCRFEVLDEEVLARAARPEPGRDQT